MKKISNQFVVNTVEDGESAPYYFQEWFAWSSVQTTADVTREPTPNGGWGTSIPAQGNYAYLWRKSIRFVWNENTRQYTQETAQYFRMSGTNGTSIHTRGQVANASSRGNGTATIITDSGAQTITLSDGDAVTQLDNGHLYQWVTEGGGKWLDLGQFKGESGATYYTHIAWATEVTLESSELPIPAGQTNRPNALAANISGFSITPLSGVSYAWMGYLIDTNSSDSQTKQNYTWQMNKGEKGDDASEVNPNILLRTIFDDGIDKVKEAWSSIWTVTAIDNTTDTIVQGRKSIRINMSNSQNEYCDFFQVIYGKLKASTWYTVSFNYFATRAWNTFLHSDVGSYPAYYDASAGIIIDGVMQTMSGNNGTWQWPADWSGKRHTMTFKTASDLSGMWQNAQLLFRVPQGCQLALCMPKLEIGEVATAYMANEDDLRGEKGDQGDRGKVGRFFYFGGVFNAADTTQTFIVNDAQAPYFEHTESGQKRYHVFNYNTNGTYTMAQMWAISSNWNNKPWESMTNDFKYIITEAIFSSFAHLGSFIISGDYFISQYGTLFYNNNGTIETTVINASSVSTLFGGSVAYTWFAYSDPMVDTMPTTGNYKFRPTKCINALSGEEWMAGGNMHVSQRGDLTVKGATMIDSVATFNDPAFYIDSMQARELYYDVFNVTKGAKYYNGDSVYSGGYYGIGDIRIKANRFFLYSEGNQNRSGIIGVSKLHIILPPAHLFVGQSLVIVNETYGFADSEVTLEQEYIHGDGVNGICLVDKTLLKVSPDYPYGSGIVLIDGAPYATDGYNPKTGKSYSQYLSNGIWHLYESQQTGHKDYTISNEVEVGGYSWFEVTAVIGEIVTDWNSVSPEIARTYNAVWMLTRWEKKQ